MSFTSEKKQTSSGKQVGIKLMYQRSSYIAQLTSDSKIAIAVTSPNPEAFQKLVIKVLLRLQQVLVEEDGVIDKEVFGRS